MTTNSPSIGTASIRMVPNFAGFGSLFRIGMYRSIKQSSLLGVGAVAGLGLAMAAVGTIAGKSFMTVELGMAKIVGLAGVAKEQMAAWADELAGISEATAQGPEKLVDALYFITSAGIRGKETMEILELSAKAATAGLGDTTIVADTLTSALNAYGVENLSAAQATDILVAAVREGKVEADAIAGAVGKVIPMASMLNIEFWEVGAAMAAMTRIGLDADESATALRGVMTTLIRPTALARKMMKDYGITAQGLRDVLKGDGNLLDLLLFLQDTFHGNEEAISTMFPRVRGLTGALALIGENADEARTVFNLLEQSTGSLDVAFGAVSETSSFVFQQALAKLQTQMLEIGKVVLPFVTAMVEDFAPVVTETLLPVMEVMFQGALDLAEGIRVIYHAFLDLPDGVKIAIGALAAFGAATILLRFNPVLVSLALLAGAIAQVGAAARAEQAATENWFQILKDYKGDSAKAIEDLILQSPNLVNIMSVLDGLGITISEFADILDESATPIETFYAVIAKQGTVDRLYMAADGVNEMERSIRAMLLGLWPAISLYKEWAYQQQIATGHAVTHREELERNLAIANDLDPALQDVVYWTWAGAEADKTAAAWAEDRAEATKILVQELLDQQAAQRALVDPIFALFDAQQRYAQAQAKLVEVEKDWRSTQADKDQAMRDVLDTLLALQAAQVGFDVTSLEAIETLRLLALEAGFTAEEFEAWLRTITGVQPAIAEAFDFTAFGFSIKNGIIKGLAGLDTELETELVRQIQAAIAGARAKFGMLSPSKVFATQLGQPMAEGVAMGIRRSGKLVFDALAEFEPHGKTGAGGAGGGRTGIASSDGRTVTVILQEGAVQVPVQFPIDQAERRKVAKAIQGALEDLEVEEPKWRRLL